MFLQIDVFLVDIVVEVEVERHIQKVDEYQFSDWSHRASGLHSLQHPHVNCRQQQKEDAGTCEGLCVVTLVNLVL